MSIASFSVKQPVLINLLMVLVLVGGYFSYRTMAKDQFPDVSVDMIQVVTLLPGSSPKEVEQLITIPLEEELAKVDEVDNLISISADGQSFIIAELEPGADVFEKITEFQNQINLVQDLPVDAETPVVQEILIPFRLMTIALVGSAPEHQVREFVQDLDDELSQVKGVEVVTVAGLREREIWVEVDPHRLHSYGLSLQDVGAALRRRNLNLPGGGIKMGRSEFVVRTEAEFVNLEQILNTIIKDDGAKHYVYLRDVAEVRDTFEDRQTLARLDGENSINITVKKDDRSNALDVTEDVRAVLADFEKRMPAGLHYRIVEDASEEIRDRLSGLYSNFAVGLGLVIVSFTFFIGVRAALMVALGLPVALMGTFIMINWYGYSVNTIVLFSMILVLGLVVDDAIVVCENVYRHFEQGMPLKKAAIHGTNEIFWPVIATVLTTIAAFLPLLLMGGVLGKFMSIIPVTVTLALTASLVECLLILPSHIAEWGAPKVGKTRKKHKVQPWLLKVIAGYERMIGGLLRARYLVVLATIVLAFGSLFLAARHMDFILFGGRDLRFFSLTVEAPAGATLVETERIMRELEGKALALSERAPEIKHVRTNVGMMENMQRGTVTSTDIGEIAIELVPLHERERLGQAVKNDFRELIVDVPGARTMTFEDRREGPPVGKAVQIRVRGDNFETLQQIAGEVKDYLATIPGVVEIMDNFPPGKEEVRPDLDLERVAALGLNVQTIAQEVRGAFDGIEATTVHDGEDEIDVVVKYAENYRDSISNLGDMMFATPMGVVPFSNLGDVERIRGFSQISHYNQKRAINVLADVVTDVVDEDGNRMTSKRVNEMVQGEFGDISRRFPGYTLDYGGEFEDTQESLESMQRAFIISLILIYVILGGLFQSFIQPLIVMFAVPFSFIGAILGFYVMNEPLGMFAIIGIIALAGIVVNDSLILIDFINSRRRDGIDPHDAIIQAGAARLRPIVLTSLTTIAGLGPMALGLFGVDQFLRPMALSIVWGLAFSTVLTLIVIPCVYRIVDDFVRIVIRRPLGLTHEEFEELQEKGAMDDADLIARHVS